MDLRAKPEPKWGRGRAGGAVGDLRGLQEGDATGALSCPEWDFIHRPCRLCDPHTSRNPRQRLDEHSADNDVHTWKTQ